MAFTLCSRDAAPLLSASAVQRPVLQSPHLHNGFLSFSLSLSVVCVSLECSCWFTNGKRMSGRRLPVKYRLGMVPEVLALPINGGSLKYLDWIKSSTKD
ncbi:hypothetical protein SDJN02_16947, partial [Cucurbita argyrosperma subsp. argyrosperma]